jgi:hypothetical protein
MKDYARVECNCLSKIYRPLREESKRHLSWTALRNDAPCRKLQVESSQVPESPELLQYQVEGMGILERAFLKNNL